MSAEPINPDDPVIRTFIGRRRAAIGERVPAYPPDRIFLISSGDGRTFSPGTYS
jgi:hypothetical protein